MAVTASNDRVNVSESPLRVLLVNDHLGWDGEVLHGVARLFLTWVPLLEDRGHEVTVCILRGEDALARYFRERDIDIRFLDRHKLDPRCLTDLVGLVRSEGFELIHAQGYGGANFGRLAGWMSDTPTIVHQHDTSEYYPWYQWLADGMMNWMADAYVAVSERVVDYWREKRNIFGLSKRDVHIMYNCVDAEEFREPEPRTVQAAREELGISAETPVVGTVTRLFAPKGNRYFVDAIPHILEFNPATSAVIVGDGPERESLEQRAQALGISEHVVFTGFRDDVSTMLGLFDVMVVASYATEGLPLTVIEAMSMGVPIVTTEIVEIVEDGVTGLVVPSEDSDALADGIIRLLRDRDLSDRLAEAARSRAEEFEAENYVERLSGLYAELAVSR